MFILNSVIIIGIVYVKSYDWISSLLKSNLENFYYRLILFNSFFKIIIMYSQGIVWLYHVHLCLCACVSGN